MRLKELIDKKKDAERELAELRGREEELNREILEAEMVMVDINISSSTVYLPDQEELHQTGESGEIVKIHISADQIADLYVSIFGEPEEDEEEEEDPLDTTVLNAAGEPCTLRDLMEDLDRKPEQLRADQADKFYYRLSGADRRVIVSGSLFEVMKTATERVDSDTSAKYTFELVARTGLKTNIIYSRRYHIGGNHG